MGGDDSKVAEATAEVVLWRNPSGLIPPLEPEAWTLALRSVPIDDFVSILLDLRTRLQLVHEHICRWKRKVERK